MRPLQAFSFKEVILYTIAILLVTDGFFSAFKPNHFIGHYWRYISNYINDIPTKEQLNFSHPFIFIGGYPRSGTTLTRVILDSHEDIRCGPETRVIPTFLTIYSDNLKSDASRARLLKSQLLGDPFDYGMAAFILEVLRYQGDMARRICTKDPYILNHNEFLLKMFPNSKFIFLLRDGRAVVKSVMEKNLTIANVNKENPWSIVRHWESMTANMIDQCLLIGESRCLPVKYESLVQKPEENMRIILKFLEVPWVDGILKYWERMEEKNVILSKLEMSTDQVNKPIYTSSLTSWATYANLTENFIANATKYFALFDILNYNITGDSLTYPSEVFGFADLEKAWEDKSKHSLIRRLIN